MNIEVCCNSYTFNEKFVWVMCRVCLARCEGMSYAAESDTDGTSFNMGDHEFKNCLILLLEYI